MHVEGQRSRSGFWGSWRQLPMSDEAGAECSRPHLDRDLHRRWIQPPIRCATWIQEDLYIYSGAVSGFRDGRISAAAKPKRKMERVASNVHHGGTMVKAFATSALVLAALLWKFVVVACSSSDSSEFPSDPRAGRGAGRLRAASSLTAEGRTAEAARRLARRRSPSRSRRRGRRRPRPSAHARRQEFKVYWTRASRTPARPKPTARAPTSRRTTRRAAACAEPDDKSGPIQWQLGRKFYTLNVAGCIARRAGRHRRRRVGMRRGLQRGRPVLARVVLSLHHRGE